MKFNKSRLVFLLKIVSVVFFIIISIFVFVNRDRRKPLSAYFSTRCLDYKQKDFSRKLNDRIVDYSAAAKLRGISACKDESELKRRISDGKLAKVTSGNSYIVEKMTFSYPCVTPDSKILLDEIARRFREKSSQKGLNGVKFFITSMTRKTDNVKSLRRYNGNASVNSPHLYGNAFDISYKRFIARKWVLTNCDKKFLKEALAEVIWQLRSENKCWATHEKMQNCYHVVSR
jgi:serine/threonine-protein kinase RIO1